MVSADHAINAIGSRGPRHFVPRIRSVFLVARASALRAFTNLFRSGPMANPINDEHIHDEHDTDAFDEQPCF